VPRPWRSWRVPRPHTQRGLCRIGQKLRRQHRYPPLRPAQGTLEPNFRPPLEHISDPQIPLTRLRKWSSCRLSVSRTTILQSDELRL
jgi:hypothetical protein